MRPAAIAEVSKLPIAARILLVQIFCRKGWVKCQTNLVLEETKTREF